MSGILVFTLLICLGGGFDGDQTLPDFSVSAKSPGHYIEVFFLTLTKRLSSRLRVLVVFKNFFFFFLNVYKCRSDKQTNAAIHT